MKFYKNQTVSISVTQPLTSTLKGTIIRTTKTKLVVDIHNHKITDFLESI